MAGCDSFCLCRELSFPFIVHLVFPVLLTTFHGVSDLLHDSKAVTKLMALSEMLSLFVNNIHILPSNGYLGENQQRFLVMSETLREEVILPLIAVYQELTEKVWGSSNRSFNSLEIAIQVT